jgi:hypothetical protein
MADEMDIKDFFVQNNSKIMFVKETKEEVQVEKWEYDPM